MAKLSLDALMRYVFPRSGSPSARVIRGPGVGEDAATIMLPGGFLVMHVDPITAARSNLGKLAIYISSNDIAVKGVRPQFSMVALLLTPEGGDGKVDAMMRDVDEAARRLGISVVGGHTEFTDAVSSDVIVVTQVGFSERPPLDIKDIKPGHMLVQIREAAMEGTFIMASDMPQILGELSEEDLREARSYLDRLSVVDVALRAAEMGVVAMHDPTEGGVIGAAAEMGRGARLRVRLHRDRVLVGALTKKICAGVAIDPLKLLSSGTLLAAADDELAEALTNEFPGESSIIGTFEEGEPGALVVDGGHAEFHSEPPEDEIYHVWRKWASRRTSSV
ncbi:MAG: AIR synthase-related protein [Conexivisphaera sp.]